MLVLVRGALWGSAVRAAQSTGLAHLTCLRPLLSQTARGRGRGSRLISFDSLRRSLLGIGQLSYKRVSGERAATACNIWTMGIMRGDPGEGGSGQRLSRFA